MNMYILIYLCQYICFTHWECFPDSLGLVYQNNTPGVSITSCNSRQGLSIAFTKPAVITIYVVIFCVCDVSCVVEN